MRTDATFKSEDGVTLRGWHYRPDGRSGRVPPIVMAHDFSVVKEMFLEFVVAPRRGHSAARRYLIFPIFRSSCSTVPIRPVYGLAFDRSRILPIFSATMSTVTGSSGSNCTPAV